MATTKGFGHYCPAARALEVVGEKWALLIVRDLLLGPQRFTDLRRALGGITPKWLTLRLRDLEAAGIVERDQAAGRREVWYRLTAKGRDLKPAVEALVGWGLEHAGPPAAGEAIDPRRTVASAAFLLDRRRVRLAAPATWAVRFGPDQAHGLRFDGERWWPRPGEGEGDLLVETTPEEWATLLAAAPAARARLAAGMAIAGDPAQVAEFRRAFGPGAATAAAGEG